MPELLETILDAVERARRGELENELLACDATASGAHEFLFFVKPEITLPDKTVQTHEIFERILGKIEAFGLQVKSVRIQAATYLDRHDIMARHYGVINQLVRDAAGQLSAEARARFAERFGNQVDQVTLLGSLEFLDRVPAFTPHALDVLWQNLAYAKLAGGTYAAPVHLDGVPIYLVNGFHPRQLEHFTQPGRSIVVFSLVGDLAWKTARNNFIGKTNPDEAAEGSLRREFLEHREQLGLRAVNASWNGVHLSAGPVEGLVELMRYQSDLDQGLEPGPADFRFGRILLQSFGEEETAALLQNPNVPFEGRSVSVFDLTEECDASEALERLQQALRIQPDAS